MICRMETNYMIKPLNDKVVVELPIEPSEANKVGLIQLLKNHDKIVHSKIVAAGPGKHLDNGKFVPMEYAVGDDVFYPAECQTTSPRIKHEDKEYLVLIQEQILCYIPVANQVVEEVTEQPVSE